MVDRAVETDPNKGVVCPRCGTRYRTYAIAKFCEKAHIVQDEKKK